MEDRPYISYPFRSPRMDASVPPNQVRIGSFGRLSGVDGRFNGCLHKYYGNREVLDIDDEVSGMGGIDTYDGIDYFKRVTFQKKGTSTVYHGFVIRWDSQNNNNNEQIDLVYTANNGDSWAVLAIWAAGNDITSALEIDCAVSGGYLMVAVDTKATKTIYWNGEALVAVSSGPGAFSAELGAMTLSTTAVDTSYQLNGSGTYQVAYRFYDSTRGVYSALSAPLTIHLDHYKTTKATGTVSFASAGGDSGLMIDGDVITIGERNYEADNDSSVTEGNVTVDITDLTEISEHAIALANAINGDSSAVVTASAQANGVLLEAKLEGSTGNGYALSVTEVAPNQNDMAVSGSTLSGGGFATSTPEKQCKAVIDFPANNAVVADEVYADFAALFNTVDVFRTIDLGSISGQTGAIFWLEQTIAKTGNWATSGAWDSLQVTIGTMVDTALSASGNKYDPEKDIVTAPPQSGTIGRYEGQTYMAQAAATDGGYDTLFSSVEHASPEYFSTYNKRVGDPEDGRPLRFIPAGNSLFQLCYNAIIHVFKSGKLRPIQIDRLHRNWGLVGKEAAHSSGNSVFMISGLGLAILNATNGNIGTISAADRIMLDDWASTKADVKSCYDALANASFFLNSSAEEILILWHSTQTVSMLDGANFVGATMGPDIATGKQVRAFFCTKTGLIVSPDVTEAGSGTMWDISSSYTLNGTAIAGAVDSLTDSAATLNADMIGAKLYMVTGDNAGIGRTIATIDNTEYNAVEETGKEITFSAEFPNAIAAGDQYAISPVPFSVRAWPVQAEEMSRFARWDTIGVSMKVRELSGFSDNPNNLWRVGVYRNSGSSIETAMAWPEVDANAPDSVEVFKDSNDKVTAIDGIDIEPYIEQIASGVSFELTDAEFVLHLTDSRKVTA